MENYNYIRLNANNFDFTKTLAKESFKLKLTISSIKKKYDTTIFGLKNIGYFALDKDQKPAAYYGVFPIIMSFDSKDILVAQSGDTMTAPAHQGKGLFIMLAKKTYQLAEEEGVQLVYGFPNKNSLPGFQKKLGWQFRGSMYKFTIKNPVLPVCEFCSKSDVLSSLYDKYSRFRLAKFSVALSEVILETFNKNKTRGYIKKDIRFYEYKLRRADIYLISFNSFTLLVKSKVHLIIGDVGFFDKDKTSDFIESIKDLAQILRCGKTTIIISKNHWLYEYLVPHIQPTESLPIGYFQINLDIPLEDISFSQADYDTF